MWVGLLQPLWQFSVNNDTKLCLVTVKIAPQCSWKAVVSEQKEQCRKCSVRCAAAQFVDCKLNSSGTIQITIWIKCTFIIQRMATIASLKICTTKTLLLLVFPHT